MNRHEKRDPGDDAEHGLDIRMFGPMQVTYGGQPIALRSGKAASILALLLLRCGREVKREWLAQMLWEDGAAGDALANLRQRLGDLRKALGPASSRLVSPTSRSLRFDAEEHEVDLQRFDRLAERPDAESLMQAVKLYTGPLLEDFAEFWALGEREARQQNFIKALERLATIALGDGSTQTAVELLSRGAAVDLFHQSLHRMLMEAYARQGNWEAALQVYADLRRALLNNHGVEPEQETIRVYQSLRSRAHDPRAMPTAIESTREAPQYRIPIPMTPLIGRESELRAIAAQLLSSRLITLTGFGGVGKTRLALEAVRLLSDTYSSGACFVDLSVVTESHEAAAAVAAALGLTGGSREPWLDRARDHLRHSHLALVMDNCEHLRAACREIAQQLLSECAHLRILATSRLPLQLTGESIVQIQPLAVGGDGPIEAETKTQSPAEELFLARATAARPGLDLRPENRILVRAICRLLDGLPLGLEIAAGLVSALSLKEIVDFLPANRLPMDAPLETVPARHGSLLTILNASYAMLAPDERRLLLWCSVFVGGWTLDAADRIVQVTTNGSNSAESPHGQRTQILPALRGLIAKSLLVVDESVGVSRYRMLDVVREYAAVRLAQQGETHAARQKHQQYYADMAAQAEPQLTGPSQSFWLHRLHTEAANLRAAILYGLEEPNAQVTMIGDTTRHASIENHRRQSGALRSPTQLPPHPLTLSLRTAVALGRFWQIRGRFTEGRELLDRLFFATSADGDTPDRADSRGWSALLAAYQGDYPAARIRAVEAREMWERLEDRSGLAGAIGVMALVEKDTGNLTLAQTLFEESLRASRLYRDAIAEASALGYLGIVAHNLGNLDDAEAHYRAGLVLRRSSEDTWGIAASLNNLALLARDRGDLKTAKDLLVDCIALRRALEDLRSLAISLNVLGKLHCDDNDMNRAEASFAESLRICRKLGDRRSIAYSLEHFGDLYIKRQEWRRATDLYRAAAELRSSIGAPLTPDAAADRASVLAEIMNRLRSDVSTDVCVPGDRVAFETLLDSLLGRQDRE